MENIIKINWTKDTYCDSTGVRKFMDSMPLNGIYEDEYDNIRYFKNGKLHNENGPSCIRKNSKMYHIGGKPHRIGGPAVIWSNGNHSWYINGRFINNKIMDNWLEENDIPINYEIWTDSDKMMFALHWSDYNG